MTDRGTLREEDTENTFKVTVPRRGYHSEEKQQKSECLEFDLRNQGKKGRQSQ